VRPSEPDLQTAVRRVIGPTPAGLPAPRMYRLREVSVVLVAFAVSIVALESEGLLAWAQRMEVGPVQSGWLAVLGPTHAAMDRLKLTWPGQRLAAVGDRIRGEVGAAEDPLLAQGWALPEELPELPTPLPEPAQSTPEPGPEEGPAEPEPAPARELRPEQVSVLLLGDSMIAGSLGSAISRSLARDKRLRVVEAFQTATGLSRPEVFDWLKVIPLLLARERPQLIICSFGANDATNIRDGDTQLDFAEPGWRSAYAARVTALMRIFTASGARVLWLGLPQMREARFSEHAAYLNGIFAQSARKVPGVDFLELRMLVSGPGGEYATYVMGPQRRLVRYRMDDGVHYSPAGAKAITRWVVDWIYERFRKLPSQPAPSR